jgi:hypothetical protein
MISAALGWGATSEVLTLAFPSVRPQGRSDSGTCSVGAVALVGGGLAGLVFVLVMAVALNLELPFGLGLAMLCVTGAVASELVSGAIARIGRTPGDPAPSGPRVG